MYLSVNSVYLPFDMALIMDFTFWRKNMDWYY